MVQFMTAIADLNPLRAISKVHAKPVRFKIKFSKMVCMHRMHISANDRDIWTHKQMLKHVKESIGTKSKSFHVALVRDLVEK